MRKKNDTVRYIAEHLKEKLARGEDRTNWERADQITGERLEASILADPDDIHVEPDWTHAIRGVPRAKTTSIFVSTTMFSNGSGQTARATRL